MNLNGRIKLPLPQCETIEFYLRENCFVSEIDYLETSLCRDKDDVHILGLAQRSLAEYIITGDKDLLDLVKYKSAKIVTPREFWTLLKTPVLDQ
jgi:predicted nucleic acid-binding protein